MGQCLSNYDLLTQLFRDASSSGGRPLRARGNKNSFGWHKTDQYHSLWASLVQHFLYSFSALFIRHYEALLYCIWSSIMKEKWCVYSISIEKNVANCNCSRVYIAKYSLCSGASIEVIRPSKTNEKFCKACFTSIWNQFPLGRRRSQTATPDDCHA